MLLAVTPTNPGSGPGQAPGSRNDLYSWIPASTGMTEKGFFGPFARLSRIEALMESAVAGEVLCDSGSPDAELSHARPECTGVHAEKFSGSPLPFYFPSRFLQGLEDVVPLHFGKFL